MAKLLIQMPDGEEVTHDLPEDKTTVGRRADNSLLIEDTSVSSHHAEIYFENNAFFVKDLGSTNGTYLNGGQIKKAELNHNDELRFGSIPCFFKSLNDSGELVVDEEEGESSEAQTSRRPANFQCSSPLPIASDTADPRAKLFLIAAAAIGLLAIGGAVFMILQIQTPTF
ncbi:MAG: FHA domain-containing protein [Spartobacteria bacterium]